MCVGVSVCLGGVVSTLQAEAPLVCSCGMWGLGVNDHLEKGIYFSWALLWNKLAFSVEGLNVVLLIRNEQAWVI